jgi:hypothetical protein
MQKLKIAVLISVIIIVMVVFFYKSQSPKYEGATSVETGIIATNDTDDPTHKVRAACPINTELYTGTSFGEYTYSFCFKPKLISVEPTDMGFTFFKLDNNGKRIDNDKFDDREISNIGGAIYYRNIPSAEDYLTMRKDPEWKFVQGESEENKNSVRIVKFDINLYGKNIQGLVAEDKNNESVMYVDYSLPIGEEEKSFIQLLSDTIQF